MTEPAEAPATLLVVEDEADIRRLETFVLEAEGYRVLTADNGADALRIAREEKPDLILLDIIIPEPDGREVCRRLRAERNFCPILFVTARKEPTDQLDGLALGADHYVVKPFSPAYLVTLVNSALRRVKEYTDTGQPGASEGRLKLGDVELDIPAKAVLRDGEEVRLTPGEWIVLEALATHRNTVLSRELLQQRLWDAVTDEGITSRTVDMHISRLRQKLGERTGGLISTRRNFGYLLDPEPDA